MSYDVWVWCLDCRLVKTSVGSGEARCRFFCKDCCTRLGCRVVHRPYDGWRMVEYLHRGYAGIEGEIEEEKQRREHRLSVGAVYVAHGKSLLLKNVEQPDLHKDDEENDHCKEEVWKAWFDLEGYPTILPLPPSASDYLPREPRTEVREMRLLNGTTAVCCFVGGQWPRYPSRRLAAIA